jgi:hypothetical protein
VSPGCSSSFTRARWESISILTVFCLDSAAYFKELVWGRTMRANIHNLRYSDEGVRQVTLGDESGTIISGVLVKEGLARVDKYGPKSKQNAPKETDVSDPTTSLPLPSDLPTSCP